MKNNSRIRLALGVLLVLLIAATATARSGFSCNWPIVGNIHAGSDGVNRTEQRATGDTDVIEKTFKVSNGATISVDTDMGAIMVEGTGNEVRVKVIKEARFGRAEDLFRRFTVDFNATSSEVEIIGRFDRPTWRTINFNVRYEITVPRNVNLVLNTAGGSLNVGGVDGNVRLHTSGGSIRLDDIGGLVDAKTSGGSIEVANLARRARLETSGGSISMRNVKEDIDAHTSGGSINAEAVAGNMNVHTSGGSIHLRDISGAVDAQTSGGGIEADFARAPRGNVNLRTSAGSVTVRLPENTRADLEADANAGRVRTDFPITGHIEKDELRGTINGGGDARITLRTSAGSININRN